jgi:hypothetical protein
MWPVVITAFPPTAIGRISLTIDVISMHVYCLQCLQCTLNESGSS